uniref:Uncharacterized protein n=1 Tax=Chelonoidis abingdonii TaxID=106734 RepID=A0A8C0H3D1_CHEAB
TYIFGEFSPDEFNQFFVTPRCSVEVRTMFQSAFNPPLCHFSPATVCLLHSSHEIK